MRKLKQIARSTAPGLYTALWWAFGEYPRLARQAARHIGYRVATGPFQGMRYPSIRTAARVLPKLVGSYEEELGGVIEECARSESPLVINVGCAEGYYAVGLALRLRSSRIVAFDSDERMRRRCRELARANAVQDDRLEIRGACDPAALTALPLAGSLIVMDCEGYERDLLLGPDAAHFARASILVETHDFLLPGVTDEIAKRFSETHEVERITSRERRASDYGATEGLPARVRVMAVDEERVLDGRRVVQEWLWMRPRAVAHGIDVRAPGSRNADRRA